MPTLKGQGPGGTASSAPSCSPSRGAGTLRAIADTTVTFVGHLLP